MAREDSMPSSIPAETLQLSGTLNLFGFPAEAAILDVVPRSLAWRGRRSAAFLAIGLILAPILGVVPPHAPWALGALAFGGFFGLRKWKERFTLFALRGLCPKCGGTMKVKKGTPLRTNLSVPCDGCHHDARLEVSFPDGSGERERESSVSSHHTDSTDSGSKMERSSP